MSPEGRIVTFYSYKGGTGRSMALANIAWILAAAGKRVLTVDWDMEAPGLHRYFHPFLADPEAASTPGVIDFVTEFAMAATQLRDDIDEDWYLPYADLARYAVSLVDTPDFPTGATLDFVSSGRQGPSYAARVNSFDWQSFWDRLGGAALLTEMRRRLREDYDYVLIDSRTGVSDTSGICTIALPDTLVVAFTLNRQSIRGAAAVTQSAVANRDRTRFRVYPVPMRVEFAEKDRLELARLEAHKEFDPYLWHIGSRKRERYWGAVEVVYHPFYAYEEVLAVFADRPEQRTSLLAALEQITAYLTDETVTAAIAPPEAERRRVLSRYQRQPETAAADGEPDARPRDRYVFLSSPSTQRDLALRLTDALERGTPPIPVVSPMRDLPGGNSWLEQVDDAIRLADCVLITVTVDESQWQLRERQVALDYGKPVVPLVVEPDSLRASLDVAGGQAIDFTGDFDVAVQTLRDYLAYVRSPEGERATLVRRLDEARRTLPGAGSESERLRLQVLVDDLEERLRTMGGDAGEGASDEFVLQIGGDDRIAARWRGAAVNSVAVADELQRRLLLLFTDWLLEGRLTKPREQEVLGELLYATVFPGAVASLLAQGLDAATPDRPLRLVITVDPEAGFLRELPFEFLYRPGESRSAGSFLATRSELLFSRALQPDLAMPAPAIDGPPMRVLLAEPGPVHQRTGIRDALVALADKAAIELRLRGDSRLSDVLDLVDEWRPTVVHLVAAGRNGSDEFELATTVGEDLEWIGLSRAVHLLAGLEARPPIIVVELQPVVPAAARPTDLARKLAELGVAAVLELASPLERGDRYEFFRSFYDNLAGGNAIDVAVKRARRHLTRRTDSPTFAIPTLYMNHPGPVAAAVDDAVRPPHATAKVGSEVIDPAIRRRLRRALDQAQPWRTLERLAIEAAVPEETAANVLHADDDVRFSRGRDGRTIVGLISRVGT